MFNKFLHFFGLFACIIGAAGGFGVSLCNREYVIAACVAVLAVMAFPTARRIFRELIG